MESLGGDQFWVDRFMAQHAAVFYYWVLIAFFAFFPSLAYMFSELVEVNLFHHPSFGENPMASKLHVSRVHNKVVFEQSSWPCGTSLFVEQGSVNNQG